AESLCVSPSTVHRHLKEVSDSVKTQAHHVLAEHLAFDEFKSTEDVEGAMSFIYCDSVTHDIIDILPDRRKHKLEDCFFKFSRKQRERVKTISNVGIA
uniref:transposase n=3 Tax=Staphylococcus schleiferi TaxID=1295 RepID=UPI001E612FE7